MTSNSPAVTPFPFVVGCRRSGTTLLRLMLDAHPALAIPDESYFVATMLRRRPPYERDGAFDTTRFITDLIAHPRFQEWALPEADVRAAFSGGRPASYAEAIRGAFTAYAAHHGKPRYGDKTPAYVRHIPTLAALFPESRFVHIVRDGRDVTLATLDVGFGPGDVGASALSWSRTVTGGRRAGRQLGVDRYLEVSYERLVAEPEAQLRAICEFLALEYDPAMLRYHEDRARLRTALADPRPHRHVALPPTPGLRDWRTQMPERDVALVEALAGAALVEFGYPRAYEEIPMSVRVRAERHRLRHAGHAAFVRARSVARQSLLGR